MLKKYGEFLLVVALIMISIGIYWNTLGNEFVNMDDLDLIVRNQYIRDLNWHNIKAIFTPGVVGAYQPIRTFSYAIDYHFWQLNPTGYHVTNMLLHAGTTLLVLLLIRILSQSLLVGTLAAALFAVHPIHAEAVTWMSGRRDVLSAFFVLGSIVCFMMFRRVRQAKMFWYAISLIFCGLGLLTKAVSVVVPLLIVLYDACFVASSTAGLRQRLKTVGKSLGVYLPFVLVTAGFLVVFLSQSKESGVAKAMYHGGSGIATLLTMIRVFTEYLYLLVFPKNLSLTYGIQTVVTLFESSFLLALLTLTGVVFLAMIAWKREKLVFFGIVWFFFALLPVSNIIPIAVVKADRYLYLPSIGFCLVVAWGLTYGWKSLSKLSEIRFERIVIHILYGLMIGGLLVAYSWQTIRRNEDWQNSETLWNATLETQPDSPIALNNLGMVYADQGLYEKAVNLYQSLLKKHPMQHGREMVYSNLGDAYAATQQLDEALDAYEQALEVNPEYLGAYIGLANVTTLLGDYANASLIYQLALTIAPYNDSAAIQLGNLRVVEGKYDDAISRFQQVLDRNSYSMSAYNGLGLSYAGKGDYDRAFLIYQQALEIEPTSAVIRNSLGTLYMQQGETEQAIQEFQQSLHIEPDNVEVRNNLGSLLLRTERYAEALQEFMESVKRQPDNPRIISNLGMAYAAVGLPEQAIEMCQWALEIDPSLFATRVLLGDICLRAGDLSCAIEAYQTAVQLQPDDQDVKQKLQEAQTRRATSE